jgi:crotonobetainyl-CoA:carnitine CoA-transferase CaiB-like acyl-CoA transferase
VLTVESTARPDGSRATPALFEALHGRSESVALALDTPTGRGRLADLLARVHVVIEGSRPRALVQMGIDADSLVRAGRPQFWVSITGHGREGDAGRRVGYGDDTAAAGGLVGHVYGDPRFLADAVADPIAGLIAAATVVQLAESGGRWIVDVALSRCAASLRSHRWLPPAESPTEPQHRRDPGAPMPLGRDTAHVLADLGVDPTKG